MHAALRFTLPADPKAAQQVLARLKEVFDLVNEDKEEQAIDPDTFTGNLPDYPEWLGAAFADEAARRALEVFGECDPDDLADWDLQNWYEDLFTCGTFNYRLRARAGEAEGRWELDFEVEEEAYGGDMAHAWLLLAAGARDLEVRPP